MYVFLASALATNQLGGDHDARGFVVYQQYFAVIAAAVICCVASGSLITLYKTSLKTRGALLVGGLLASFYLHSLVSVLWSSQAWLATQKAVAFGITSLVAVLLAHSVDSIRTLATFSAAIAILCGGGLALGIWGADIAFMYDGGGHFSGIFRNRNGLSSAAAIALATLMALGVCGYVRRPVLAAASLVFIASIVWAGSLAGYAALLLIPVILWVASRPRRVAGLVLTGLTIVGCVLVAIWPFELVELSGDKLVFGEWSVSTHKRFPIWMFGFEKIAERPLNGYGLMGFWTDARSAAYLDEHGYTVANMHNGFMHVLVEQGLVGWLLLATFLVSLYLAISLVWRRGLPSEVYVCAVFILMFLFFNVFEYYLMRATQFLQTLFTYCVVRIVYVRTQRGTGNEDQSW